MTPGVGLCFCLIMICGLKGQVLMLTTWCNHGRSQYLCCKFRTYGIAKSADEPNVAMSRPHVDCCLHHWKLDVGSSKHYCGNILTQSTAEHNTVHYIRPACNTEQAASTYTQLQLFSALTQYFLLVQTHGSQAAVPFSIHSFNQRPTVLPDG